MCMIYPFTLPSSKLLLFLWNCRRIQSDFADIQWSSWSCLDDWFSKREVPANKRASGQGKSQRQHLRLQKYSSSSWVQRFLSKLLVQQSGAHGEELILGKETGDLQKLLLDTVPKESIKDNLRQKILQAIDLGAVSPRVPDATQDSLASASSQVRSKEDKGGVGVPIKHYAPKYNPDRWNKIQVILRYNNCYNYANQKITNSFAQPGYASGYKPYPYPMTPGNVIKACESDGLVKMDVDPSAPCPKAPPQPNCLIALFVAESKSAHLPLPQTNINTYFSLRAKCWLRGGVGGLFPRNV